MNRKRILAIAKLVLLFGTPLALILGLFSCGVYHGVGNRTEILRFERDWLGLDVVVPSETTKPEAKADAKPEAKADAKPEVKADAKPDAKPADPAPPASEPPSVVQPPAAEVPPPAEMPPQAVPAPLPPPETRVDPLDEGLAARLRLPVVVRVKVLVDESLVAEHPDWIDYVQRTVSRASSIYEQQLGIRLELSGVGRWSVAPEGMGAADLLGDLHERPREGSDVVLGLTSRPFDGTTSGKADTPRPESPFNGAYGVVYATPGHREGHLRGLLHEVSHLFGAKDIVDPEHPDHRAGSWMSYANVPETQAPWIDADNRQRILERKDRPFAPDAQPMPAEDEG